MRSHTISLFLLALFVFILFVAIPVSAIKTNEQSVSGSLTRGSRFTVTITGLPNTSYYIWIPQTFTMTGEPGDQPPVIADYIQNVMKDPAGGPYIIGSYQYNNGNGQTIIDNVAPATATMSNTNYYALVTTDTNGIAVIEFLTSVNTGLRSYSVKVENPDSADSDNLQVRATVYSRKAPSITAFTQVPEDDPAIIPYTITVTKSPNPTTTVTTKIPSITTTPTSITTMIPATKAECSFIPIICMFIIVAVFSRFKR